MKIKPDNGYKMLISVPGKEKVLVDVDVLSSLNTDFLAQLWLIAGPQRRFFPFSSPSPQTQEALLWPQVVGQLFDPHLVSFGSSWARRYELFTKLPTPAQVSCAARFLTNCSRPVWVSSVFGRLGSLSGPRFPAPGGAVSL